MKSKIVFLDIDGVMTNIHDRSSYILKDPATYRISPDNFKNLISILDEADAEVVISSNWRKFDMDDPKWWYGGKWYHSTLPALLKMLGSRCAGSLPSVRHITKSTALDLWFKSKNEEYVKTLKYVILDDDMSEGFQDDPEFSRHLILTNPKHGLTKENVKKALEILR